MIIKKVAFGDSKEAFIEDRLKKGFNIISSDDNNKGKTLMMQAALYAIGNEPIFPSSFNHEDYYYYVEIELDTGFILKCCRKGHSFIVQVNDAISLIDSVSELKRYLNRNGFLFPEIVKDNMIKMVDPVLLYQVFFVGQDKKDTSTIFNDNYYKKEDFWNLVYSLAGVSPKLVSLIDKDEAKRRIARLEEEKKLLLARNKILKTGEPSVDVISQTRSNDVFEEKVKQIDSINKTIIDITNARNKALSRKALNEKTLKEIRSLNKPVEAGGLYCVDCGSKKVAYSSGDKSYSFEITDVGTRNNIIESIKDKIIAYQEEIERLTQELYGYQQHLQTLLSETDISLEALLLYRNDIVHAKDADTRLVEIASEIKSLKEALKFDSNSVTVEQDKKDRIRKHIIQEMNDFYKQIDPTGTIVFDDMFSKNRANVFSGCEETEFYLARLYALARVLRHNYPIMMDYFRDGELSTEKEAVVIRKFSQMQNQIIFTVTLKDEEAGKYKKSKGINAIDYSENTTSHVLSKQKVIGFKRLLKPLMIKL